MIVCLCKAVSDRDIQKAVSEGHCSLKSVARSCGAGTGTACGSCHEAIREIISKYAPHAHPPPRRR